MTYSFIFRKGDRFESFSGIKKEPNKGFNWINSLQIHFHGV